MQTHLAARVALALLAVVAVAACGDDDTSGAAGTSSGGAGGDGGGSAATGGDAAGGAGGGGSSSAPGAYPRIASYLIETYVSPEAADMLARVELGIVDAEAGALDPAVLAEVRERNPDGQLLAYVTSEEIQHELDPEERPLSAARLASMPPSHWLLEPGSFLAEPVDAETDRFRVVDPDAFTVERPESDFYEWDEPTFLLVDAEHVRLVAIEGDELIVERGYHSDPAPHGEGAHVGAHVVFFAGTWMLNLAATAPTSPEGTRWRDTLADEAAGMVESGLWSGVFLDVCFSDVGFLNGGLLDVDADRLADDPDQASAEWTEGFGELVDTLRERLGPDVPIIANPGGQDCPHANLDGILMEGFPIGLPEDFLAFDVGLERYLDWSSRSPYTVANSFSPLIGFGEIEEGADEIARTDYAAMRFGLGVALMGDGLYAFDNGVFGHYVSWWYDEYDGAGRGLGWLGAPRGEASWREDGVATREFDGGVVVVNTGVDDAVVDVPDGLTRLAGSQDPAHNDGSPVDGELVVPAADAFLLARD